MGIVDKIKDTARKIDNSLVDTTEEIFSITKSPKELAKKLIEHLNHNEYNKMAEVITEKVKKYVAKSGLDDVAMVNNKLQDLESKINKLVKDFEENNYSQVALKLKELELSIAEISGPLSEVFKTIKGCLSKISEVLEGYDKEGGREAGRKSKDFIKLQEVFEEYFTKLAT